MGVKGPRSGRENSIVGVWQREVGQLSTRNFVHRLADSQDLVLRLDILRKLEKHRGWVNTVSFNSSGEILVSGADDKKVILWDWELGRSKLSFHSGHCNDIFQAKFMPYSEDHNIVTCAADGQVRHAQILEGGRVKTSLLGIHEGRAFKLAIEPRSPYIFYSCGEDGLVQLFDLRINASMELFTCHSTFERENDIVSLNAITIDPRSPNLFAVGGSDEYTRVYDIRRFKADRSTDFDQPINYYCPKHLVDNEHEQITSLAFSFQSELLVSYSDEYIYLFTKDMGWGPKPPHLSPVSTCSGAGEPRHDDFSEVDRSETDTESKPVPQVYKGHRNLITKKDASFFGPKSEYVVSGSDCRRIFVWRKKDRELLRVMEAKDVVNCIEAHPYAVVLASSGTNADIKIWTPKAEERATLPADIAEMQRRWMQQADDDDDDDDDGSS